ncbi:MAG TPA: phosphopentomutase [Firmicutes bacterium]|nr:phosphopentomutase [Bacillota bacterium]
MQNCRVFLVVLDGVGIGELPDAYRYGDEGSNTLGNIAQGVGGLNLPFMGELGLGNIIPLQGVPATTQARGAFGKMAEASPGKDTITGHWEMTGVVLNRPFPVYPNGFPAELILKFEKAIGRQVLGNIPASGTAIIKELGEEHLATGFPIVYTSADSVFQIAAHEELIPVTELYQICQTAREILSGEHMVARVIARPFLGKPGSFQRTTRRKDFSVESPEETILDRLVSKGFNTVGVGKIEDIFSNRGLTASYHTGDNFTTMEKLWQLAVTLTGPVLIFANCIDFDTLYGHRNDVQGFANALETADSSLKQLFSLLKADDILIITADHGCDPTIPSTDHSREYVPLLVAGERVKKGATLGVRGSFADLSATIADLFAITEWSKGNSFYRELVGN